MKSGLHCQQHFQFYQKYEEPLSHSAACSHCEYIVRFCDVQIESASGSWKFELNGFKSKAKVNQEDLFESSCFCGFRVQ